MSLQLSWALVLSCVCFVWGIHFPDQNQVIFWQAKGGLNLVVHVNFGGKKFEVGFGINNSWNIQYQNVQVACKYAF